MDMVDNYTGYAPLGIVMVALLGIGIAESSGLISAAIRLACNQSTFVDAYLRNCTGRHPFQHSFRPGLCTHHFDGMNYLSCCWKSSHCQE
ncbi:MAG: AbgT family transporter [Bacteroidales bacterium]|nr:AbgT family transporter [Bacteroidales bacterium]